MPGARSRPLDRYQGFEPCSMLSAVLRVRAAGQRCRWRAACGGSEPTAPPRPAAPVTNPGRSGHGGDRHGRVTFAGTRAGGATDHDGFGSLLCTNTRRRRPRRVVVGDERRAAERLRLREGRPRQPDVPGARRRRSSSIRRAAGIAPHVFGVQVGQPLEILNSDATLHNIHALPMANREFNVGQALQGMQAHARLQHARGDGAVQVRRPQLDERVCRRARPSVLRRDAAPTARSR